MKKIYVVMLGLMVSGAAFAQESMKQVMEKRATEMIRVIGLSDKTQWKKFIKENYTQALIDRKMQMKRQSSDGETAPKEDTKQTDNLEEKAAVYAMLHRDLGEGKIISMKQTEEKLEVDVKSAAGENMKFSFTFTKEKPYLIDALGVQLNRQR